MALFIPADEQQKTMNLKPENGTDFQLTELYRLLDCSTIELVQAFNGDILVIDGDGKEIKPENRRATELVPFARVADMKKMLAKNPGMFFFTPDGWQDLPDDAKVDYIAGDVIVCKQDEIR